MAGMQDKHAQPEQRGVCAWITGYLEQTAKTGHQTSGRLDRAGCALRVMASAMRRDFARRHMRDVAATRSSQRSAVTTGTSLATPRDVNSSVRRSRRGLDVPLVVVLLAITSACEVSNDQEVALGRENAATIEQQLPIVSQPDLAGYVQALGDSIAHSTSRRDLEWRFRIVDSDAINAFALPGGFVYVNRGLVDRAETLSELAGVLGHEIGHVVERHSVEQMQSRQKAGVAVTLVCTLTNVCESGAVQTAVNVGGSALFARHSRRDEAEADSVAVEIVTEAGFAPAGIPKFFQRLARERERSPTVLDAFFGSHPMEESRVRATAAHVARLDPVVLRELSVDAPHFQEFKRRMAALPPSPRVEQPAATP